MKGRKELGNSWRRCVLICSTPCNWNCRGWRKTRRGAERSPYCLAEAVDVASIPLAFIFSHQHTQYSAGSHATLVNSQSLDVDLQNPSVYPTNYPVSQSKARRSRQQLQYHQRIDQSSREPKKSVRLQVGRELDLATLIPGRERTVVSAPCNIGGGSRGNNGSNNAAEDASLRVSTGLGDRERVGPAVRFRVVT